MSCAHIDRLQLLQPPKLSQSVHREECTQCFDNQDASEGIEVCLTCFNGGCLDVERHHARTHVQKSGHRFTLNVKRKAKPKLTGRAEDVEPPLKMTKLAIVEEREEDKFEHATVVKCWECDAQRGSEIPNAISHPNVKSLVDGVMQSMSSARQSEVRAWEEDITPCEHTLTLEQFATDSIPASGLAHCNACDLKENLWLCLTCGSLGCGRQQFGSSGGNGHGLSHYEVSRHPVSVKLGTITPEGTADVYCYTCNDSKEDPDIARHLSSFGINVQTLKKTEKSMTELQIEQNLKYDFSLTTEDGKALEPVFGPGLTGLANLGNSCYMASVLQAVFSLPAFQTRYSEPSGVSPIKHAETCTASLPAECIECQMRKVADGLLSGRYSYPANAPPSASSVQPPTTLADTLQHPSPTPVFQLGIKPTGFKTLIGKGHEEFATMRQQDSEEFFTHLITALRRDGQKYKERADQDPTKVFSYAMEQRLQCTECRKVGYRTDTAEVLSVAVPATEKGKDDDDKPIYADVQLTECIEGVLGKEALEYACPECKKTVVATRQSKFASLPEILVVHAKKFQLVNWVPAKLDIPIVLPENDDLQFTDYHMGRGLQAGEVQLSNGNSTGSGSAPTLPEFNAAAMGQLQAMGFPEVRCQKALLATGNSDPEAAMEWLFMHMEDPDIDEPIKVGSAGTVAGGGRGAPEPEPGQVDMLVDMGFTSSQARKALRETGGDPGRAVDWLFSHPDDTGEGSSPATTNPASSSQSSVLPGRTDTPARYKLIAFVSHKGLSVHSGHYVVHIRKGADGDWVLFNDEKVVKADATSVGELKKLAYMYFFVRV